MKTIQKQIEFIKNSGILNFLEQFNDDAELASFIHVEVYACNYTIGNYMYVNTEYSESKDELIKHLKEEKYNFKKENINKKFLLLGPDSFYSEAFFFDNKREFNQSMEIISNISSAIYNEYEEPTIKQFLTFIYVYDDYKKLDEILKAKTTTDKKINKI